MTSPSSNPSHSDGEGVNNGPRKRMIAKAVRYARASLRARLSAQQLIEALNRNPAELRDTPLTPPRAFSAALRKPVGSKRKPVTVCVGGRSLSLLLNPQGHIDVEREQWLWDYVRGLLEGEEAA